MTYDINRAIHRIQALAPALAFDPDPRGVENAFLGARVYSIATTPNALIARVFDPNEGRRILYVGQRAARAYQACQLHAAFRAMGVDISEFPRPSARRPNAPAHDAVRGYRLIAACTGDTQSWALSSPAGPVLEDIDSPEAAGLYATAHALTTTGQRAAALA